MFSDRDDGSAVVSHIPISPFVPLQHNKVDVTTLNRLANFGMRFAREHGWCSCNPARATLHQAEGASGGQLPIVDDVTVFFAGVELELAEAVPTFDKQGTAASLFFSAQFWVSYVGTSSYGVHGKIYKYKAGEENDRALLGTFNLVVVSVSSVTRRPVAIPVPHGETMRALLEKNKTASSLPRLQRIDVKQLVEHSDLVAARSQEEFQCSIPTHPINVSQKVMHYREFQLRETDIDFNRHVNQVAAIQMIINTFRSAVADDTTVFPQLLDDGVDTLESDLLIRRFRIDYVKEIPADHAALAVMLFFQDDALIFSKASRQNRLTDLLFVLKGIKANGGDVFVSSVGTMSVFC